MTHAHVPFTSLINELNQISLYFDDHYHSITSINHSPIHHYPNECCQLFVISLSNSSSSHPRQEKTALIPIWSIPSWIYLWLKNNAFCVTYSMTSTQILHKPHLTYYKNMRALYSLIPTIHTIYIPNIQHSHVPPITHNILSITLHMSTYYPIKTHPNLKFA